VRKQAKARHWKRSHAIASRCLEEIACDCVAMSGGWSPVVHLWSHCGGKLNWDDEGFVTCAGTANGHLFTAEAIADGFAAGRAAAKSAGHVEKVGPAPIGEDASEAPLS